ncbi:hypothetical protein CEXT_634452 [Caerostris extrusa]|uniref:Uncharacterized protein n=1 Tax=Caerostris extrusa TaxID=172846 RepID=A0AAV4SEB2_CAEEX|nr:hypothetical protein CEXT_634452 [Caerostris extrusa]
MPKKSTSPKCFSKSRASLEKQLLQSIKNRHQISSGLEEICLIRRAFGDKKPELVAWRKICLFLIDSPEYQRSQRDRKGFLNHGKSPEAAYQSKKRRWISSQIRQDMFNPQAIGKKSCFLARSCCLAKHVLIFDWSKKETISPIYQKFVWFTV